MARRGRTARRRGLWLPLSQSTTVAASTTAKTNLLQNLTLDLESAGGLTLQTCIGRVGIRCDVVGTYAQYSMMIGVHREDVAASDMDWHSEADSGPMWTSFGYTSGLFNEVAAGDFDGVIEWESLRTRAMRKIPANHSLDFVIHNSSGQTLAYYIALRMRILLP